MYCGELDILDGAWTEVLTAQCSPQLFGRGPEVFRTGASRE